MRNKFLVTIILLFLISSQTIYCIIEEEKKDDSFIYFNDKTNLSIKLRKSWDIITVPEKNYNTQNILFAFKGVKYYDLYFIEGICFKNNSDLKNFLNKSLDNNIKDGFKILRNNEIYINNLKSYEVFKVAFEDKLEFIYIDYYFNFDNYNYCITFKTYRPLYYCFYYEIKEIINSIDFTLKDIITKDSNNIGKIRLKKIWEKSVLALREKEYKSTIDILLSGEGIDPYFGRLYWEVAYLYYSIFKNYEKAIEYFNKTISIDPYYLNAYGDLGNSYIEVGERKKAIDCYNEVLKLYPNQLFALFALINCYYDEKDYNNTELYIKKFYLSYENDKDLYSDEEIRDYQQIMNMIKRIEIELINQNK